MALADAEHFVASPEWTWYILFYFFLAGISGGSYFIATLLRLYGKPADEPVVRLGYYVALPALAICPILLTLDLGKPLRTWHMFWNTTPGEEGLNFKYWSPMSVGVWALTIFSVFAAISFAEVLVRDKVIRHPLAARAVRLLDGRPGRVFGAVGAVFGLFVAGYTGVLLAVSNQPVWSDTWMLSGLFLASGLSSSAALLAFLVRYRPAAHASTGMLVLSERLYAVLELALIAAFALTLIPAGALGEAFGFPWLLLWLIAVAGITPGCYGLMTDRLTVTANGAVTAQPLLAASAVPGLVLLGTLALRAAVIFSIQ